MTVKYKYEIKALSKDTPLDQELITLEEFTTDPVTDEEFLRIKDDFLSHISNKYNLSENHIQIVWQIIADSKIVEKDIDLKIVAEYGVRRFDNVKRDSLKVTDKWIRFHMINDDSDVNVAIDKVCEYWIHDHEDTAEEKEVFDLE